MILNKHSRIVTQDPTQPATQAMRNNFVQHTLYEVIRRFTADMAIHNVIGDSFRGATWVSIHNGGGVGWGEVINGGFGMLLDGTSEAFV